MLTGDFGRPDTPRIAEFAARDPDNADTVYSAFDEISLAFDMPTDRAGLTPVGRQPAALVDPAATGAGLRSGDRRWVDQYFEFSCSLGLDYSGEWESDAQRVRYP